MITYLPELTYPEVEQLLERNPVLLVPIGAIEAHGPHLPLETDTLLSMELAQRAAEALGNAAIAAPIPFTAAGYASSFAGTLSIPPATAQALLRDVGIGLVRMGFSKLCFVNSHLDPAHVDVLRAARNEIEVATYLKVAFPDQLEPRWARTLSDEYKRAACHAGSYETSLLLASPGARHLVRDAERAALPALDINLAKAMKAGATRFEEAGATRAYFGNPAGATIDEGEWLYTRLVEMVVTVVRETWP
ncbi:MAG: creatininase family protein [Polyangia bacterium]